jgi:hypothetical protein
MTPDIQYFGESGTWVKPVGTVRVDIVLQGAGAGSVPTALSGSTTFTRAHLGRRVNPNGIQASNGEPGEIRVSSWDADDLDDTVAVTAGKGGRPGGRDGYALVVTHLAGSPDEGVCDGEMVTTRHYDTELTGPVDVPLCAPCAAAQFLEELT